MVAILSHKFETFRPILNEFAWSFWAGAEAGIIGMPFVTVQTGLQGL